MALVLSSLWKNAKDIPWSNLNIKVCVSLIICTRLYIFLCYDNGSCSDFRNKKVNWKMSRQYDILGSSGESSQGGGGSGVVLVVNGEDRAPELEPLLAEVSSQRDDQNNYYHHHHDQYYYDTDNDQYYDHHQYYHHHHHDHHDHRPPSYYQHQNTYVPRSSIRYHKVSARSKLKKRNDFPRLLKVSFPPFDPIGNRSR